jgi:hypothetical protein
MVGLSPFNSDAGVRLTTLRAGDVGSTPTGESCGLIGKSPAVF